MIRIRDISVPPEHDRQQLMTEAARLLKIPVEQIRGLTLARRSVDARKKPDVRVIYTVDVTVSGSEESVLRKSR